MVNFDALAVTAKILSLTHFKSPAAPTEGVGGNLGVGAGDVEQFWKADAGDSYSASEFVAILGVPGPGTGTEQDFNQFLFKFDDQIHGSEYDDMLCGWAGNDRSWGGGGDDKFYYGKGMDRDRIMDFEKGEDLYIDNSIANKFKKLKKMAKYNEKKDMTKIKAGDGDVLKVYGIDTKKEFKQAVVFDDFTDFA